MASIEQMQLPVDALQEKSTTDDVSDGLQDQKQQETLAAAPRDVDLVLPPGGETTEEEENISAAPSDELIARELDAKAEITAADGEAVELPTKKTEEEEAAAPPDAVAPVEPAVSDEPPQPPETEEDGKAKTAEEVRSVEKKDG